MLQIVAISLYILPWPIPVERQVLMGAAVVVTLATVVLFFTGLPLELVALGAAAIVLLDRIKPQKIYRQVDWSLLTMFTGLFIVVHAFQVHVVAGWGIEGWPGADWAVAACCGPVPCALPCACGTAGGGNC